MVEGVPSAVALKPTPSRRRDLMTVRALHSSSCCQRAPGARAGQARPRLLGGAAGRCSTNGEWPTNQSSLPPPPRPAISPALDDLHACTRTGGRGRGTGGGAWHRGRLWGGALAYRDGSVISITHQPMDLREPQGVGGRVCVGGERGPRPPRMRLDPQARA